MPRAARPRRLGVEAADVEGGRVARDPAGVRRDRSTRCSTSCPACVAGGADLTGNTGTELKGAPAVATHDFGGRQIHFGVREHGMGAIMNGMAVGGLLPAGGTFFVFSDYMRGAVRLAALSRLQGRVRLVARLGRRRRGRPHAPADRAAGGDPGDARAAGHPSGRRQRDRRGVARAHRRRRPDRAHPHPPEGAGARRHRRAGRRRASPRGAYVLVDEDGDGLDLVLIGTGSEVPLCVDARDLAATALVGAGRVDAVVGAVRGAARRRTASTVLPPDVPTLAVEAGATLRLGALRRRRRRHRPLRRVGPGRRSPCASSASPRERRRARARAARSSNGASSMTQPRSPGSTTSARAPGTTTSPAPLADRRRAGAAGRRRRHPRRHVEPDDLRQGDRRRRGLRRAAARAAPRSGLSIEDTYWALVARRHRRTPPTCCARCYDALDGGDGFVSSRSSPTLAHDTDGTIAQAARSLHARRPAQRHDQDPGDARGHPGDRGDDRGRHQRQRHADLLARPSRRGDRGVPRPGSSGCVARGGDPSTVASVASFFVSRVDTETDRRLPEGTPLRGKAAVANAKLAYELFRERFSGSRWDALAAKGARLQRPLWASTSTKNPAYSADALRRRAHRPRHRQHAGAGVDRRAAAAARATCGPTP